MNRCLRQGFCSSWKYVFVYVPLCVGHVLISFSFCHIKTGQSGSGPPIFFLFAQIFTVMDTFSFVGGNIVRYFVLLLDRNISESTQRFQWVIPEDSVTFQQADRAPRLRPGRGQGNIGRQREKRAERNSETKLEMDSF